MLIESMEDKRLPDRQIEKESKAITEKVDNNEKKNENYKNFDQNNSSKLEKSLKYLIFAIILFLILRYVPKKLLSTNEIITITTLGSIIFSIIDIVSPTVKISYFNQEIAKL